MVWTCARIDLTIGIMATAQDQSKIAVRKRFGSEIDVETLTGIKRSTLQADRFFGRDRFPYYRVRGKVLYDLAEVERIILASRSGGRTA